MDIDHFDKMLQKQINADQFDKFCEQRTLYFKSKTTANQFFQSVVDICGAKTVIKSIY